VRGRHTAAASAEGVATAADITREGEPDRHARQGAASRIPHLPTAGTDGKGREKVRKL
jgi:hypothetical protein